MDFNLDRLKTFIVVARTGTLSEAARELGTTQPNVGRQMTALEKELRLTLFVRHSRGIGLTKQGEEFLIVCKDIVGQLAQRTDMIREKDLTPEGTLKIAVGTAALEKILEHLPAFYQKFPNLYFSFSSVADIFQFQIGDADVGIVPTTFSDPDLIQHPLHDMILRVYASPNYLKEHGKPKTPNDLKAHKLIIYKDESNEILNYLTRIMGSTPFDYNSEVFIKVNSGIALQSALIKGYGIGAFGYDQNLIERNLLVDVFPELSDQKVPYYFTYHRRLAGSPKVQAFHEFMKEIVKVWERPDKK